MIRMILKLALSALLAWTSYAALVQAPAARAAEARNAARMIRPLTADDKRAAWAALDRGPMNFED